MFSAECRRVKTIHGIDHRFLLIASGERNHRFFTDLDIDVILIGLNTSFREISEYPREQISSFSLITCPPFFPCPQLTGQSLYIVPQPGMRQMVFVNRDGL